MASQPTSKLRFLTVTGEELDSPKDWQPALIEITAARETWRAVHVKRQQSPLPVFLQVLNGHERILASWPGSGPGWYQLRLFIGDQVEDTLRFAIKPAKITDAAFARLIQDLETTLPAAIAVGLQKVGALRG
jgi:hypothetical protein